MGTCVWKKEFRTDDTELIRYGVVSLSKGHVGILTPSTQNVTLFSDRVFIGVTKFKMRSSE